LFSLNLFFAKDTKHYKPYFFVIQERVRFNLCMKSTDSLIILSKSLLYQVNRYRNDSIIRCDVDFSDEPKDLPTEEYLDKLIFSIAHNVRLRFEKSIYLDQLFILFAVTPAIFINVLKIIFNILNGTLICPCFDTIGEAQMLDKIGRLKIVIYPNDHNPPHFHVKTEHYNLRFTSETCDPILNKGKYPIRSVDLKAIKHWHAENKSYLADIWDKYTKNR